MSLTHRRRVYRDWSLYSILLEGVRFRAVSVKDYWAATGRLAGSLVGRCPAQGHPITLSDEGGANFSCLCPGRADGIYAEAFGGLVDRAVTPHTLTPHPAAADPQP